MEFLIYADEEFFKITGRGTRWAAHRFEQALGFLGGSVKHSSAEFGTLVVELPDHQVSGFQDFLQKDAAVKPLIKGIKPLQHQVRINLTDEFTAAVRNNPSDPALKPLMDVLEKYNARIKSQFDAFADFCKQAEEAGETGSTLYKWTKATIEKPGKKEHYSSRFTVYADGGKEVYGKAFADGLEADLKPLLASGMITKLNRFNTDPAQNPQAGPQFG